MNLKTLTKDPRNQIQKAEKIKAFSSNNENHKSTLEPTLSFQSTFYNQETELIKNKQHWKTTLKVGIRFEIEDSIHRFKLINYKSIKY